MTLSKKDQERYAALAARAEAEEYTPIEQVADRATGTRTTPDELDRLLERSGGPIPAPSDSSSKLTLIPDTALYGEDAAASGRALLLAATGADTIEEATRIALGHPNPDVGEPH